MYDFFAERYGFGPWDMARMTISEAKMYVNGAEARKKRNSGICKAGKVVVYLTANGSGNKRHWQSMNDYFRIWPFGSLSQ